MIIWFDRSYSAFSYMPPEFINRKYMAIFLMIYIVPNGIKKDPCSYDRLYVLVGGKLLHDRIISLRGEVLAYKFSLTQPILYLSQESDRSCIYV